MTPDEIDRDRDAFVRVASHVLRTETPLRSSQRIADSQGNGDPVDRAREVISGEGYGFEERRALTKRLVYDVVLDGMDERILKLFESVRFFMPNDVPIRPIADESAWKNVLTLIIQHQIGTAMQSEPIESRQGRDVPVAQAAKRLRVRGFNIELLGGGFRVDYAEAERLWKYISGQASTRPSRDSMIQMLFRNVTQYWRAPIGRYVIPRFLGTTLLKQQPSTPWNYALQLAARPWANALATPCVSPIISDAELLQVISDVVALFDIEPYSVWELTNPSSKEYLERLIALAQLQAVLDFPQRPCTDLLPLLQHLFCWLPGSREETALPFALVDALAFATAYLEATATQSRGPFVIRRAEIMDRLPRPIAEEQLSSLWKALVHEPGTVNVNFASPVDWARATLVTKPFVARGNDAVEITDSALANESFLIALLKAVCSAIPDANNRIGRVGFESYVCDRLSAGGSQVVRGLYGPPGLQSEIDALLETEDAIVLIECKKRMLSPDAMAGNRDQVVREIISTVARGHQQLLHAERELISNGQIVVSGNTVALNGREVYRVVVSLHDWGVLHDQATLNYMLTTLLRVTFNHTNGSDPRVEDWINDVNSVAARLVDDVRALDLLKPARSSSPFRHAFFLPIGLVDLMLGRCGDAASLVQHLRTRASLITGNLESYADFEHFSDIHAVRHQERNGAQRQAQGGSPEL